MITHCLISPPIVYTQITGIGPVLVCKTRATIDPETAYIALQDPPTCKRCIKKLSKDAQKPRVAA